MTRRGFRSPAPADPFMYGLLATLAVVGILLLIVMLVYPILLAPSCEPAFPDIQLPTLGLDG
jgi:hypothetical protein